MEHQEAPGPHRSNFSKPQPARIFQIPVEEFPILWGHVYLVVLDDPTRALSRPHRYRFGVWDSNRHLEDGLRAAAEIAGEPTRFSDLTHIFITHGHIDHLGAFLTCARTDARIGSTSWICVI
jgi:glyoxylase-like metal-dependent hydrolase (beta-lactamase superfamily II)